MATTKKFEVANEISVEQANNHTINVVDDLPF